MPRRPQDSPPRDPQQIIDELQRENERLREDMRRSEIERNRLRRENERLKEELEMARRRANRQAAPFSRGLPTEHPQRPGRKAGAAYGRKAHRRPPPHVDVTHDVPLPPACPDCGGPVTRQRLVSQYQEDLPVQRPVVHQFRVAIGACRQCHRRVQGRHPLQTSDALGAAAVQLGPQAVALAVILNKQCGLSFGRITHLLRDRFGLTVSRGGLVHAVHRAARQTQPTYEALCATVRGSPVVTPDETGWKVGGHPYWLWAFATPDTTTYAIEDGRGFAQAARMLGADYAGVLQRDGWAPYRQFVHAAHQTCLAHLLRRCRTMMLDHPQHPFAPQVQALLQAALATRQRHAAGTVSVHGLAVARGTYVNRLARLLDRRPSRLADARRFAVHLSAEFEAVFSFLFDPTLDATNWRAEHALRPAVITRKTCGGGNRTAHGAHTQQVLASILRTAQQRGLDTTTVLVTALQSPTPVVLDAFQSAPLH
ncbi:MAG TPA: IS66 family transposase [Chloroflexota bacterium]|nr:IS66 family transposase [Chloroflexota bacterium]